MKLRVGLTLLLTAVCLMGVVTRIDTDEALQALSAMGWGWLMPVLALYLVAHALRVQRLRLLLDAPAATLPFGTAFSLVSVGYLAIHVVPLRMGELVRPWLLRERLGVPFGTAVAAIVLERVLDLLMLLGMLLVVGVAVDVSSGVVIQGVDVLRVGQRGAAVIVCVAVLGLLGLALTGEALLRRTDRLPAGATVRRFSEALRSLLARPARGLAALGLSVLIWAVTIAAVQRALAAFPGLPSGPLEALTTWALTLAGMTAIPTPGFFGGYEAACSTTLGMLGADATRAGAFAILLHLGQFAFTIAIGVACLLKEGLDLRSVVQQSRTHVSG